MGGPGKHSPAATVTGDLRALFPITTRRTKVFAYGFFIVFIACTAFLAFSPSGNAGSPWYNSLFTSSSISTSIAPYRSQFSSLVSFFFPNSSSPVSQIPPHNLTESRVGSQRDGFWGDGLPGIGAPAKNQTVNVLNSGKNGVLAKNQSNSGVGLQGSKNQTTEVMGSLKNGVLTKNQEKKSSGLQGNVVVAMNQTSKGLDPLKGGVLGKNQPKEVTGSEKVLGSDVKNQTERGKNQTDPAAVSPKNGDLKKNQTAQGPSQDLKKSMSAAPVQVSVNGGQKRDVSIDKMMNCDIFQGKWVRDDSYPLYPEGSCPHIDEPFDCYRNGRQDRAYQKLRWQPNGCNIPRLNGSDMLERLRGKRLVFVGDSLNRNMWESLVCVLRNSLKDKKKVFEASGRHQFRTEGSYSFLFKDYGCTVEFFRSPFLVQEWEMPDHNGSKKETLRLDIVERSASKYKDAYAIIFNTGHWWTHEKTSQGKDYYQEGNHVYSELNAAEAFHKALNTWARWVDSNVNPKKSHVFFRGYSASHFSGGQWNSGGQCDRETEPIKNEKYLSSYPPKMSILEEVIKGMKTHVSYMNITRMTDYRKDAHPSIYRKPNMTKEEKAPDQIQDCSHWCLPGVPDSWNELLYAQLLIKQHQKEH